MNARLSGPLGVSLAAIVVITIVLVLSVPSLLDALSVEIHTDPTTEGQLASVLTTHEEHATQYEARYEGRSAFFIPPRPRVPVNQSREEAPPPPTPETRDAPTSYAGPLQPISSFGSSVMFRRGGQSIIVRVGDEASGVRVVNLHAPWYVTVAWTKPPDGHITYREGRYDLPFWSDSESGPGSPFLSEPRRSGGMLGSMLGSQRGAERSGFGTMPPEDNTSPLSAANANSSDRRRQSGQGPREDQEDDEDPNFEEDEENPDD